MNATRVLPKCMFNEARTEVTNVRDPMTGEVFEAVLFPWPPGEILFMGYCKHEGDEVPLGDNGLTRLYCRVLGPADKGRVENIHRRLPKRYRLPLSNLKWIQVHYD